MKTVEDWLLAFRQTYLVHPGTEAQESYLGTDHSVPGRQTDPGDRRTSNWRSSTPGSDTTSPLTGRSTWVSPTRDTPGNASRTLMTGLRRPDQCVVTTFGGADDRELRNPTAHHWLWARLIQEEYPLEGDFMNTKGPGTSSWFRPGIALRDIPKRLTILLSGTDNRRNHSDEVEALQLRARLYATAIRSNG